MENVPLAGDKNKKRKTGYNIIIFLCVIIIFGCIAALIYIYYPEIESYHTYKSVANEAVDDDHTYDWDKLKEINPDIIGWIWIPDTVVDYPVVQTSNNDYYLYTGFNGEYNKYGTIFLDCDFTLDATPAMQNQVLYGHANTTSERQMFAGLKYYEDSSYYTDHPTIYYTRIEDGNQPVAYEIIDVIKVQADYDYRRPQFADQEDFLSYYANIHNISLYDTGKTAQANDQIVTLSTCVFDIEDGRLAVIARRAQ